MSLVTVKSKCDSFRRAGIEFSRAGVEIESDDLTPAQMLAIVSEPQLTFLVDGAVIDRPSAEDIADLRAAIEREATEKADQERADAEVKKPAPKQTGTEAKQPDEATAAKDTKAGKKKAK